MGSKKDRFSEKELRTIFREEVTAALEKFRLVPTDTHVVAGIDCE